MQIFLRFENPIEKAAARSRDDDERLWDVPWWIGSYRFSKRSFQDPLICLLAGFRVQIALGWPRCVRSDFASLQWPGQQLRQR